MSDVLRVLIWGLDGAGRAAAELIESIGWNVVGFAGGGPADVGAEVPPGPWRIVLSEEMLQSGAPLPEGVDAVVPALQDGVLRLRAIVTLGRRCSPAAIHPNAVVSRFARVGYGSIVSAGAVVNAGAEIGEGVLIGAGAIVEHDCRVENGVRIGTGAVVTGSVVLGELASIGANATILPGLSIGAGAIVGDGSVVNHDVGQNVTVAGTPARIIQRPTK